MVTQRGTHPSTRPVSPGLAKATKAAAADARGLKPCPSPGSGRSLPPWPQVGDPALGFSEVNIRPCCSDVEGEARAGPHYAWPRQLESQPSCPLLDWSEQLRTSRTV
ncbi:hypothetical protein NN561_004837 [Cricetulus griseus]